MSSTRLFACAAAATLACCSTGHDGWEDDLGKADLGLAQPIDFEHAQGGSIHDYDDLNLFVVELEAGDAIQVEQTITDGDLQPDFILLRGFEDKVKSKSHTVLEDGLTKDYDIALDGNYYLAVRAYKGQGSGEYRLTLSCLDGPCSEEPLELIPHIECLQKARECALTRGRQGGGVEPSAVAAIHAACVAEVQTDDGQDCDRACDDDARELCDDHVRFVGLFTKKSDECIAALNECLTACIELGVGYDQVELEDSAESVCLETGFNKTCDIYALNHKACGGTDYADGETAQCEALCYATDGAWEDALDNMCEESCS